MENLVTYIILIIAALVTDVLCQWFQPEPSNTNLNGWSQLSNQSQESQFHVNPVWAEPYQTTPWPTLGRHNIQPTPTYNSFNGSPRSNDQSQTVQVNRLWVINHTTPWPALGRPHLNQPTSAWVRPDLNQPTPTWVRPPVQATHFQPALPLGTTFTNRSRQQEGSNSESQPRQYEHDIEDEELRQFCESLLERDVNNAASLVNVNYQSKTTSRSPDDEAPQPLLNIHRNVYNIPTVAKLILLYNNYIVESTVNEEVTSQEVSEEDNFLETVLSTPVMEMTRNFLIDKGVVSANQVEFRRILKEMWFDMYTRGGRKVGSSGFEHVFLAEIKNRVVSGLHNWIYFNSVEANGGANYLGYLKKIDLGDKGAILKYHFTFHNIDKPVGSMFIGTSPEFEFALYSMCFLARPDRVCPLRLGGKRCSLASQERMCKGLVGVIVFLEATRAYQNFIKVTP